MNPLKWLLEPVAKVFTSYNENRTKLKQADLNIKLAEKTNTARLLSDEQGNNHAWEMANLTDKDKWLRRISFAMFAAPFIWALFDANAVKEYFEVALASMPEWYIQLFAAIVGGIWGFSALKNSLPAVVGGIKKAFKE